MLKCQLSRRQKYLYDEFINRDSNQNQLRHQDFLGMMNIVIQLRKVCNHPDLFENRLIQSPFRMPVALHLLFPRLLRDLYGDSLRCSSSCPPSLYYDFYHDVAKPLLCLPPVPPPALPSHMVSTLPSLLQRDSLIYTQFSFCCIRVSQQPPSLYFSNSRQCRPKVTDQLMSSIKAARDETHLINVRQQLCFPSKELIIFDSGKLVTLMNLLLRLKANKQKALIFT